MVRALRNGAFILGVAHSVARFPRAPKFPHKYRAAYFTLIKRNKLCVKALPSCEPEGGNALLKSGRVLVFTKEKGAALLGGAQRVVN